MTQIRKPILITGSHRSGSTWVGKTIARSPRVGYIKEPFNPTHRPGICRARFDGYFTYVCDENEDAYIDGILGMLAFDYDWRGELAAIHSAKDALRMGRDGSSFLCSRMQDVRPLMKDPIALFSTEWLADRFDMDVVVLIRHPAAFAASLFRKGFQFDFADFESQPLLMRDLLAPYQEEIEHAASQELDIVDQAILLWRLFYAVVDRYRAAYPSWHFVRHDDLSREPVDQFRRIFAHLNVAFTDDIERHIRQQTSASNPGQVHGTGDRYNLDSAANITAWKRFFTPEQIDRIRSGTEDVAPRFYTCEEW